MKNTQALKSQTPEVTPALALAPAPPAKDGGGAMVRLSKGPDGRQRFVRNIGDLEAVATSEALATSTVTSTATLADSASSDKSPGRNFDKGRDLFVLAAIAMIAAAIGYGLFVQMGLASAAAAALGIGAFVLLILVHVAGRRSGQVKTLRRQLQDLERELQALRGESGPETTASPAADRNGTAKVEPSLETGSRAAAGGTDGGTEGAGLRLDPLDMPLAGSLMSQGTGLNERQDELLLAGTQLELAAEGSGGRIASDRDSGGRPVPGAIGARHAPPPSRSPPARSGTPPDSEETFVTSMVPVPPPHRASEGLGASQSDLSQAELSQSELSQPELSQAGLSQPDLSQSGPSQPNNGQPTQAAAAVAADRNPDPAPAAPSSQTSGPDATSELMRPSPTASAEDSDTGQQCEGPQFFEPGLSSAPRPDPQAVTDNALDEAFEPVSLAPIAAPPSATDEAQAKGDRAPPPPPPLASAAAPPPLPAATLPVPIDAPAVPSSSGSGDMQSPRVDESAANPQQTGTMDLAGSVEALRGVAQEMQEMQDVQTSGDQLQAAPIASAPDAAAQLDGAAPAETGGPVVIAATDAGSWDGVGEAATAARRSDEIVDAIGAERFELYVTPIHGLDDRKARHLELAVRLKLLSGDLLESADYDDVLTGNGLRPTLDVAKLASCAKLAGRLSGGGKKAAVFSNYAGASMANDQFLDALADLLNNREHLAGHLVLAFGLSDVRQFRELHWDTIDTLRELGFRFSLEQITDLDIDFDDLKAHGFDFIKLDADVFLHGMPLGDTVVPAADLCSHLAEVGQALIVGHIEDEVKLGKILGFGVLLGQGAMFGGARAVTLASLQKTQTEAA